MLKKILFALALLIFTVLVLPSQVLAAECGGVQTSIINCDDKTGETSIFELLVSIRDFMSIGVGILAVIGISYAGVLYLKAGDNEEQVRKAKKLIFEVIIGIIAYVALALILELLNMNNTSG